MEECRVEGRGTHPKGLFSKWMWAATSASRAHGKAAADAKAAPATASADAKGGKGQKGGGDQKAAAQKPTFTPEGEPITPTKGGLAANSNSKFVVANKVPDAGFVETANELALISRQDSIRPEAGGNPAAPAKDAKAPAK